MNVSANVESVGDVATTPFPEKMVRRVRSQDGAHALVLNRATPTSEGQIMENITGLTRGGRTWTAQFVTDLDQKKCIGCGRCYKVCPREVFELIERTELPEFEDEDLDEDNAIMSLKDLLDCTGCGACGRVCPKGCLTHAPMPLAA